MEGSTVTVTFDDARGIGATSKSVRDYFGDYTVADYGWENGDVYLLAYEPTDPAVVHFDAPALLVDKRTGKLTEVHGLLGHDPIPGLVPVGSPPE